MPSDPTTYSWKPLRLLTFYRLILTGLLTVLYYTLTAANPFNVIKPELFATVLLVYLAFSLVVGFTARLHWPNYYFQSFVQVIVDIIAITLLMHASSGIGSSLSVLMVVAVGAGALLLPGRIAFLFAAIAALTILGESAFDVLVLNKPNAGNITTAGLLGMVLFAAAGLAYFLAARVRESEALAAQRSIDLANLEQLNQHVIQHLQSGVLVVDTDDEIRMSNTTARQLLGIEKTSHNLAQAGPDLHIQLQRWQNDHSWQPENIQAASSGNDIIPRFSEINTAQGKGTLVFLDDSATLAHQSQQIKLASLGRLSASIAHEIRNPLGAISHAAQLLEESEQIDSSDKRLIEIIGNHSQRVNTIIENVLQLSRRKPSQLQHIHLKTWLDQLTAEFCMAENISRTQVEVEVTPASLTAHSDPDNLHQVLWNLLQNAIRHAGDPPQVKLHAHQIENNPATLDIIDNGPGIDEDTANKIFEPFFTTKSTGTGLGLYLARELCELNHCHLVYQRDNPDHCCFRIHFSV